MQRTIIDIETKRAPDEVLAKLEPEFTADARLKDPAKIAADIETKRAEWRERCALDAITGCVLAVGTWTEDGYQVAHGDEFSVLTVAMSKIGDRLCNGQVIGFNIKRFDLPFLVKRARVHGIKPPGQLLERRGGRLYWSPLVIDLMEEWTCGTWEVKGQSLDNIAKCLGLPCKLGNGAQFADLYATDRQAALAYLERDVEITRLLAERLL